MSHSTASSIAKTSGSLSAATKSRARPKGHSKARKSRKAALVTTVVNRRTAKDYHNIARPTKWGNPFTHLATKNSNLVKCATREEAVDEYRVYLLGSRRDLLIQLPELCGKQLGCWCHPELCHGDVLVELIDLFESGLICRQCGCTQNFACADGCSWAAPGLCSVCAEDPSHGPEDVMRIV